MPRTRTTAAERQTDTYQHDDKAVQRPDVGLQAEFAEKREPRSYRYDSSLDPQLSWDENCEREFAEWLLALIEEAADKGEQAVFAKPQVWQGDGRRVESLKGAVMLLKSLSSPFLNWAGKAERNQITVPTVPLFVHERHSTKAILETIKHRKAAGEHLDLFADQKMDITDRLAAYEHEGPWANRLILGDSLQVMNSLLEYESLGGQVQMIYMDPPYGVKFGSNFQPFVRKRDVKHGADDHMIREPEMVKAYRDTWELGLHSYLTLLRDRLLLARELLTNSGSIFVQISDENLHYVREVMDEVFGFENFIAIICYAKTTSTTSEGLSVVNDYIVWYAKNRLAGTIINPLYKAKKPGEVGGTGYNKVLLTDGTLTPISRFNGKLPEGAKVCTTGDLTSSKPPGDFPVEFNGETWRPIKGYWKTGKDGMARLIKAGRVTSGKTTLGYIRLLDDFRYFEINNIWTDTVGQNQFGTEGKIYAVQTANVAIERCLLMATKPGDLVLDPTCGSGTTAYVAEKWGRRWMACDTSRVPLALARQRLLTATFPWYQLKDPKSGPAGGFVYKRKQNRKGEEIGGLVPHVTLKSIANDEEPKMEVLVDRPEKESKITRVTGPFTVEATLPAASEIVEYLPTPTVGTADTHVSYACEDPSTHIDRMLEMLRQSKTLNLPRNRTLSLESVSRLAETEFVHAEAVEANGDHRRAAVVFGPESGAISSHLVFEAAREAYFLKYDQLFLFGFAIQAKARELTENTKKLKIPCTYVAVTPDVVMSDLLKTTRSSEIFSITGLPDIAIKKTDQRNDKSETLYSVEIEGLDIFDPSTLETDSIDAANLPCWMLDTDYNDLCFYASQVFFPKTSAWDKLKRSLGASYDDSVWGHLSGTVSEPFAHGEHKRIAVKAIDERGNELMVVREVNSSL